MQVLATAITGTWAAVGPGGVRVITSGKNETETPVVTV